jgi:hypothetical protein
MQTLAGTSSQWKRQWKSWAVIILLVCIFLAYHARTAWEFKNVEKKAQIVAIAISSYPNLYSNITVRALPVKGIVLVEGEVETESNLFLLRKIIESTKVPATIYVHNVK